MSFGVLTLGEATGLQLPVKCVASVDLINAAMHNHALVQVDDATRDKEPVFDETLDVDDVTDTLNAGLIIEDVEHIPALVTEPDISRERLREASEPDRPLEDRAETVARTDLMVRVDIDPLRCTANAAIINRIASAQPRRRNVVIELVVGVEDYAAILIYRQAACAEVKAHSLLTKAVVPDGFGGGACE